LSKETLKLLIALIEAIVREEVDEATCSYRHASTGLTNRRRIASLKSKLEKLVSKGEEDYDGTI